MALPLKKITPIAPEELGPKIVPMPLYDVDPTDIEDVAEEEVAFVLQRATVLEDDSIIDEVDRTFRKAVTTSSRDLENLRNVAENEPLRFIAMVAAASFVIGFGVRLWRSSRG
ncbi:MAG TPA: hypothetical protein VH088_04840 [Terriglobales bacterium]|nr:hypothetical protein [Terriglobales bacterium]